MQKALDALMGSRTITAIAHRPSTIVNADVINVIERGRVVESGSHRAAGPLRWVPSLGGYRLAGSHLPAQDPSETGR